MTLQVANHHFELEADFGLDPYVLPRFDGLVSQGPITRDLTDSLIEQHRKAGWPMTPDELQPRPYPFVPSMSWGKEFGGPEIRSQSKQPGDVDFQGCCGQGRRSSRTKLEICRLN